MHPRRFLPGRSLGLAALVAAVLGGFAASPKASAAEPPPATGARAGLRQHPDQPRYLEFRGRPTLLITSGEHYGAVLNADFDFRRYLAALAADGLNHTRVFTGGAYVEPPGAFNIASNTLAPGPGRYLAPWARSSEPGYAGGGAKFDLERWDPAYFRRLREFMGEASRLGVVVEVNLFCPFYEDPQWLLSPLHPDNNIHGAGRGVARTNVYTLDRHGGLLAFQERLARKLVEELRDFDNVTFELCNEPYFGGVTIAWQHHLADVLTEAQRGHPVPKLISQNIANGSARVEAPHPHVAILNFHYASPPDAVALNLGLGRVIGDNETGFRGTQDRPYRIEAWDFLVAGGGLFNHLDYSFVAGFEDGTFQYPPTQPGGGNPGFRRQLGVLRDFMNRFEFVRMNPDPALLGRSTLPEAVSGRALVEPGRQYALYFHVREPRKDAPSPAPPAPAAGAVNLRLELPAGAYDAEWVDPRTGSVLGRATLAEGAARPWELPAPAFTEDLALRILRTSTRP